MNEMAPPRLAYPQSFGAALRGARERRGLSIGDIAARLHLHPRQVRALEAEDLSALPEAPYARGFLRNYAREVDLDPAPLLTAYEARLVAEAPAVATTAASTPPGGTARASRLPSGSDGGRKLVLIGVVAVLVVLAAIGLASRRAERAAAARDAARLAEAPVAAAPVPAPVAEPTPPPTESSTASAPTPAPSPPPAPGNGLVMKFSGESWVQVMQADGRVLLSRLEAAGAEEQIVASAPLNVTIGNAPAVAVEYHGKRVDLVPYTRADAVARVTLQ